MAESKESDAIHPKILSHAIADGCHWAWSTSTILRRIRPCDLAQLQYYSKWTLHQATLLPRLASSRPAAASNEGAKLTVKHSPEQRHNVKRRHGVRLNGQQLQQLEEHTLHAAEARERDTRQREHGMKMAEVSLGRVCRRWALRQREEETLAEGEAELGIWGVWLV